MILFRVFTFLCISQLIRLCVFLILGFVCFIVFYDVFLYVQSVYDLIQ